MADDTVEAAIANYKQARTEWYELSGNADSADVLLFHAEMELAFDALIAAVRAETIEEAITFIKARGDIETAVVAPGMWFAAGYLREDFPR